MTDSHFKLEHRFYPTYPMKVELDAWRATPRSERFSRSADFSAQIHQLLFERIKLVHPDWNHEQHAMMFFKLRYAGDHFEAFARADSLKYTSISHPELDEDRNIWPSAAERGSNF